MKAPLHVPASAQGERLDIFLTAESPETTRSQIAKQIKAGLILVNGKPASVHQFLKEGDVISEGEGKKEEMVVETGRRTQDGHSPAPLNIIEETADWIVLDKPVGVVVHPDVKHPDGTLVDALLQHFPAMAKVGEDPQRPGIMHRLDKEVGGLMVVAKTQAAFESLKKQFASHSVDKRYMALVYGEVTLDEGEIKFRIGRSNSKSRMAAMPVKSSEGKAAWTHYKVVKRYHNATLLELTILSGRTHQIRAHLFAFNHPVIGDPLYTRSNLPRNIVGPHTLLQSVYLSFIDPQSGERKSFSLAPSSAFDDMAKILSTKT